MAAKNSQTYCRRDLGDSGEQKPNETLTNENSVVKYQNQQEPPSGKTSFGNETLAI
jgi:hypothetical protein